MEIKELNSTLRSQARELGLCDEWYKNWKKKESMQKLIEKYLKGIDFCIKHDYPSLDFTRENFPKDILNTNGIFLDNEVDATNIQKAVLLGDSRGSLSYSGQISGDIYIRHHSDVVIQAKEGAKLFVEIYDQCNVMVTADEYSKVFVYQHGGNVYAEGNVTIRNKAAE